MQKVTGEYQALSSDPESAGDGTRGIGGRLVKLNPSLAALVTWLVCLPVAFAAAAIGQGDPFRLRVAMIPVAVLVAGVIAVGLATRRLPADLASGIAAGLGRRLGGVHVAGGGARHAVRVRRAGQ